MDSSYSEPGYRNHIKRVIERQSPFDDSPTAPSGELIDYLLNQCKVLVIGAGGLGCELIKDLALMGFRDLQIIDMDTIELSNLNRQFLFQTKDIGRPKAVVAAEMMSQYMDDCQIIAHHAKIEDFDAQFYSKFNIIICGLDSIEARRWINKMMVDILRYDAETGTLDTSSVIPLIDGGTEGLKGNARIILPGLTACIECNLDLYPTPVAYPLCTIANKPRLPEHCIEYVKTIMWPKLEPFGPGIALDKDQRAHIDWIHEKSIARAREYNIETFTYRFTQGVVKRTIAAVSSTNSCVAALCAMEAFKLATDCVNKLMNNFQVINLSSSFYSYTFEAEKDPNCLVCGKTSLEVLEVKSQQQQQQ